MLGADQDVIPPDSLFGAEEFTEYQLDPDVGAVVFGMDFKFSNHKLLLASLYLNEMKVPLIASSDDVSALIKGRFFPATGALLQSVLTACNLKKGSSVRSSSIDEPGTFDLVGKPNPFTIELIK